MGADGGGEIMDEELTHTHKDRQLNPGKTDSQPNRRLYDGDEPAPTVAFGHDASGWRWVQRERSGERSGEGFDPHEMPSQALTSKTGSAWTLHTNRGQDENGDRQTRPAPAPAPALTSKAGGQWHRIADLPATTLGGDPRFSARDHHEEGSQGKRASSSSSVRDGEYESGTAIRVTAEEAAILQGFPREYPFLGSRTQQFQQIGNAVPPPLARAVLAALLFGPDG